MYSKITALFFISYLILSTSINSLAVDITNTELVFYNQSNSTLFVKLCQSVDKNAESPLVGNVFVNDKISAIVPLDSSKYELQIYSSDTTNSELCAKDPKLEPKDPFYIETIGSTKLAQSLSGVSKREITYKTKVIETQVSKNLPKPLDVGIDIGIPFGVKEQALAFKIQASSLLQIVLTDKVTGTEHPIEKLDICINNTVVKPLIKSQLEQTQFPDSVFFKLEGTEALVNGVLTPANIANPAANATCLAPATNQKITIQPGLKYLYEASLDPADKTELTPLYCTSILNKYILL
jgi:hypothetical protein